MPGHGEGSSCEGGLQRGGPSKKWYEDYEQRSYEKIIGLTETIPGDLYELPGQDLREDGVGSPCIRRAIRCARHFHLLI